MEDAGEESIEGAKTAIDKGNAAVQDAQKNAEAGIETVQRKLEDAKISDDKPDEVGISILLPSAFR